MLTQGTPKLPHMGKKLLDTRVKHVEKDPGPFCVGKHTLLLKELISLYLQEIWKKVHTNESIYFDHKNMEIIL